MALDLEYYFMEGDSKTSCGYAHRMMYLWGGSLSRPWIPLSPTAGGVTVRMFIINPYLGSQTTFMNLKSKYHTEGGAQCLPPALTFGELTLNVLYLKDVDSRRLKSLYCLLSRQWTGARASHGAGVLQEPEHHTGRGTLGLAVK